MLIKRGQIYFANLPMNVGHVQTGTRPVVIIQNNTGNQHSPTVIVACITSQLKKPEQPTHIMFSGFPGKIKNGMILCEQLYTIDKTQLKKLIGSLNEHGQKELDKALKVSLSL
jgi:mRNA interferase MazF